MIIAQEKRKTNIAEFILYMWQVEDLIRASGFDLERVDENVIRKFDLPPETLEEIRTWYSNLITLMAEERIVNKGHMSFLNNLIRELNDLHLRLGNRGMPHRPIWLSHAAPEADRRLGRDPECHGQLQQPACCPFNPIP
jgi:hypothetical protein